MKQTIKTLLFAGVVLSLFGCGDDDKKVDSGAIADSVCKSMVQCEGKLGKLPGTLTAAEVQNKIDTCNNLIVAKFFNNAKSDSEAADYMKCLEGLECNALDSVYTSQGDTVPQACQSQHQAYTNSKNGNGGSGGNGNTITCDPNNEVCACFDDSCNPKWITDNSCICQGGGSSNPPTGQCADDDIACWCKKSPNLPACQGGSNPPADQCSDDDLACQCKKNPNLPACQETPPPADQCSDDDLACQCKKNPNLPACQETPPPADQCSDDDLACQCKKNPNLPACKSGNDEVITCTSEICKCFEDSCNPEWVTDNACKCKGSGGGSGTDDGGDWSSVEGALATYCKNNMDVMVECSSFYKTMDNCKAKFPEGKCANKLNSMLTCMNNIPCATHKAWNDVIMECYQKKDTATCDAENPRPCDAQINAYEACAGVIWWW